MKHGSISSYILATLLCLGLWKITAILVASPVLPPPETAFGAFFQHLHSDSFWQHFTASAYRVSISILLAWVTAFPCGVISGYSNRIDKIFSPIIFMTYPIPKMVLLPVILLLFGLGNLSKIILISLILFFQIVVATRDGVKAIDKKFYDSVRSMGGGRLAVIRHAVLPAALPHSFTALRISTGTAISVLFFAESFATNSGLGYMIMDAWGKADYNQIFVGIIGMSLQGLLLYEFFRYLEEKICAWRFAAKTEGETTMGNAFSKSVTYSKMIKLSHTIFALPFALSSVILVNRVEPVTVEKIFWIIIAMVGARSAAMGFNRLSDAEIDAGNPRTATREIPAGNISRTEAALFVGISALLFIFAAWMLSTLCFWLSFPVLAILFLYSYTKRFTWMAHIYLGFAIGLAPIAAWVAVAGSIDPRIIVLSLVLLTYIAGFDIMYACQDFAFDSSRGLHSIPARFGIRKSLAASSLLHIISVGLLIWLYFIFPLHPAYLIFTAVIVEHRLVNPDDLSKINIAFFHVNSAVSIIVFVAILAGDLLGGGL